MNFILGGEFVPTGKRNRTFTLKKPGAFHHARFMGKTIYLSKIYILSLIFNRLTPRENAGLERMVIFILALYGKYFLTSSLTASSPRLDIEFIKQLKMFKNIDSDISECVLKSVKRHLWYLTPELVTLSLFDKDMSDDEKKLLARELSKISVPECFKSGKPSFVQLIDKIDKESLSLAELVDENSWFILEKAKQFLRVTGISPSLG